MKSGSGVPSTSVTGESSDSHHPSLLFGSGKRSSGNTLKDRFTKLDLLVAAAQEKCRWPRIA
ncbi:MAG: hypothetical protein KA250_18780 [Verrucomicrobiales bacterium]|nr:hypothetical protein [Verrucomicrobiales bacterium]MBP9225733.1 hypothetical protein [Verrucomicrobiales bacterium]HQZ28492.1 hypothetical protein [Verrucomicrobiales bacterium]